jgi:hypothetical protein
MNNPAPDTQDPVNQGVRQGRGVDVGRLPCAPRVYRLASCPGAAGSRAATAISVLTGALAALPFGAPGEGPPCIRHLPFAIACDWHGLPLSVFAPQRFDRCMSNCMGLILQFRLHPAPRR